MILSWLEWRRIRGELGAQTECITLDTGAVGAGSLWYDGEQLVTCGGGSYPSEVSWAILDADGMIIVRWFSI